MNIDFNIDNYLRLSLSDVLLTCAATLIIVLVAKHFFWDKLLNYLKKRQEYISQNLADSRKSLQEAHELRNEYLEKLKQADQEAEQILIEARGKADLQAKKIVAQAEQDAEYLEKKAREQIEMEQAQAQEEIRQAISEVAFAAAEQILNRDITVADQEDLINQFIDQEMAKS